MEFFFKQGGQAGGDRNKPFKSSLCEAHKDISTEQIREWIYTGSILGGSGSQRSIQAPLGAPRPFEGFQEIKTICLITLRYYLPFSLYWPFGMNGAKALQGKTGTFAGVQAGTPTCTSHHCICYYCGLAVNKTLPGSFEKVLDEAVKIIKCIEFRPLSTSLFNILYDQMGRTHKALLLHTQGGCLSLGKSTVPLLEFIAELAAFRVQCHFTY